MAACGVKGVYIRAMTWKGEEDHAFKLNWAMYKGFPRGAYGFTSTTTPLAHANKFVDIIEATGDPGELPPWMDYEDVKITPLPPRPDEKKTLTWLERVEKLYRRPMIYTSRVMWFTKAPAWTNEYKLAVANYTAALRPTMPAGWLDWYMWQYSAKGDGIAYGVKSLQIDMDRMRKEDWEKLTGEHEPTVAEILADHETRIRLLEAKQ